MSETSPAVVNTHVGIVSRRDGRHIFVWCSTYPLREIKFLYCNVTWFECGELVRFKMPSPENLDAEQDSSNISKDNAMNIKVLRPNLLDYRVQAHLSFPPENSDYFKEELSDTKLLGCRAIAYSVEFGKVALFSENLKMADYELGRPYIGYVTRMSTDRDWIGQRLGTLFVLTDTPLEEIVERARLEKVSERMPWKNIYATTVDADRNNNNSVKQFETTSASGISITKTPIELESYPTSARQSRRVEFSDEIDCRWHESAAIPPKGPLQSAKYEMHPSPMALQSSTAADYSSMLTSSTSARPAADGNANNEHTAFVNFVMSNIQWTHNQDSVAAIRLQKEIMDLCFRYNLEIIEKKKQMQQQQRGGAQYGEGSSSSRFHTD